MRLLFALAVVFAASVKAEESPPLVGDLGNPGRIMVEGAKTFSPAQIVRELFGDLDVANATYPTASLEDFRRTITEKALAGYKTAGFAEATAETRLDASAGKLVLTIVEGPRYIASAVEVSGLPEAEAEWLRQELTARPEELDHSPEREPAKRRKILRWPVGKPAWCADESLSGCREQIVDLALERGRLFPEFTVVARLDREHRTATLQVVFTDPGRPALLDEIRITGNKANSRKDILNYLGLTPAMPFTGELFTRTTDKLIRSGRFIQPRVKLIKPAAPGEPLALSIQVSEYGKAPLLRNALSKEEAALVKLSEWVTAFNDSQEELLMTDKRDDMTVEIAFAPRSGIVAVLRETSSNEGKTPAPFALAIVSDKNHLALYSTRRQRQLRLANRPDRLTAHVQFHLHTEPPNLDGSGRLMFGVGAGPRARRHTLLDVKIKGTAVSMLSLAHEYQSQMSWNNDILTVLYKGYRLAVDRTTGRLVTARRPEQNRWASEIVSGRGEFERRLHEVQAAGSMFPNDADAEKPVTSVLRFLCAESAARAPEDIRKEIDTIQHLLASGLLHPLERRMIAAEPPEGSEFSLPVAESIQWGFDDAWSLMIRGCARLANFEIDSWVPHGSWAERLTREAVLAVFGKSEHLHSEIYRQTSSRDAGPLRYLGTALTLRMAGLNDAAARQALHGAFRRLLADDFINDCEALLDPSLLVGECVFNTCRVLGQLDQDEAATLCQSLIRLGVLAETDRDLLAACLARLRAAADEPDREAVRQLLAVVWEAGLRDRVVRALRWCVSTGTKGRSPQPSRSPVVNLPGYRDTPAQDNANGAAGKKADDGPVFKRLDPFQPLDPFPPANQEQAKSSAPRYR